MTFKKFDVILVLCIQIVFLVLFITFTSYGDYNAEEKYASFPHIRLKLALVVVFLQLAIFLTFVTFCEYSQEADASDLRISLAPVFGGLRDSTEINYDNYRMFQDIHVMIFVGFGFLMAFLRRYGYSAVGFNFLLGALIIQWALLCQGFYQLTESNKIKLGIESLYKADIAAATVLISMGAVLGRTSYLQLLIMGIAEIAVYSANSFLGSNVFQVSDAGGSIFVHAFGAYFGLAVSYALTTKNEKAADDTSPGEATYSSNLFAMIGTIFLWLFWPSFNAIEANRDGRQRAIVNTYLALAASCVATFAASLIFSKERRFDMVHIQNSTLAGGVAVGTCANLMLQPYGAIATGIAAGFISVAGFSKLTPWMSARLRVLDTCGVHNLHGMPGVLAGLIGALMALIASESIYNKTLYETYPARSPRNMEATPEYNFLKPGLGRTAEEQAGYQMLALVVTIVVAISFGLVTGYILKILKLGVVSTENFYDDAIFWILLEPIATAKKSTVAENYNISELELIPENVPSPTEGTR